MHSHSHLFEKVQRTTRTHTQTQPHTHTHLHTYHTYLPHTLTHTHLPHTPPAVLGAKLEKSLNVSHAASLGPGTSLAPSPPRCSLPPSSPGSRGCGESVPTAATVASVYPSCRASCRVSRQHSRATSNAVAHIRRLNDSFIHYFPALSSQLSLPFSLSPSLSLPLSPTLSPTRSACFFVCSQSHYTNLHISCMCFGQRRI